VQDRLGRTDDDDEIGLDERGVNAGGIGDRDYPVVGRVVHQDAATKRARLRWRQQASELTLAEPATEPAGDEDRLPLVPYAAELECPHCCRERFLTRILWCAGKGQGRWLDEDRRPTSARCNRLERRSGKRESQGVANCGARIDDPRGRRRRTNDDVLVAYGNDDDA
jgi:hypothetical protein